MRGIAAFVLATVAAASLAMAADAPTTAPPDAPFAKVSDLTSLPDFLPGLGTLYVDPDTLPAGPFYAYDHDGQLSATVYMTPWEDLQNGTAYTDLGVGSDTVTSVDIMYNAGHEGVPKPHVHVILYHDADAKGRIAE